PAAPVSFAKPPLARRRKPAPPRGGDAFSRKARRQMVGEHGASHSRRSHRHSKSQPAEYQSHPHEHHPVRACPKTGTGRLESQVLSPFWNRLWLPERQVASLLPPRQRGCQKKPPKKLLKTGPPGGVCVVHSMTFLNNAGNQPPEGKK